MDNDLSLIWGPPGTGKSFTLASILYTLYHLGEDRTAVCCLSNVAVDQLLCKLLDIIDGEKIEPGNIYRAGRSIDSRIIATDYLFPKDERTQTLRDEIRQNQERILRLKELKQEKSEESIMLKAANKELREDLRTHTEDLVKSSRLVFSTISNFILSTILYESKFDNLIVDEASMMAMPSLLTLGHNISKRLILVGDFQQLSPISMVKDDLLVDSVFEMSDVNIRNTNHPALKQLLTQRRSNEKIVDLINRTFYQGKLIPEAKENENIINAEPFPGKVIALKKVTDGAVRYTKGGTRQNKVFAESVMDILDAMSKYRDADFTIGVITPYKGQVSLLRALKRDRNYDDDFDKRIKIGTIHTFQGSECDIVIFDMVDCFKLENSKNPNRIGRLYKGNAGERLLNVAVSRAKHKLIVVCDPEYIKNIPGNKITPNSRSLFHKLSKY
jgi:superfamily I DNA and/or RNA helicase